MLQRFLVEEDGINSVEYGLIGTLIALACLASLGLIRSALQTTFIAWSSSM
ncbi:MAG TPA: Flp family type IVb pilin [Deltaproteobacteria bacterium]|nr:Flp family type IVb pilin [Deltaproteobacteria bacterium]